MNEFEEWLTNERKNFRLVFFLTWFLVVVVYGCQYLMETYPFLAYVNIVSFILLIIFSTAYVVSLGRLAKALESRSIVWILGVMLLPIVGYLGSYFLMTRKINNRLPKA